MSPLWKKLNLRDQTTILALNAPESFECHLEDLSEIRVLRSFGRNKSIPFVMIFATKQAELAKAAERIKDQCDGDIVLWIAYPKKSSKKYQCDFDRDHGWAPLGKIGFEGVRQVAIDEDWSALRFRRVQFIKKMKRNPKMAISKAGRARTKKK